MSVLIAPIDKMYFKQIDSGDKSLTHRALVFGSIASGKTVLTNALICADTLCTIDCLRSLGARIDVCGNTVTVYPISKPNNDVLLNCGNSGTTARLLAGLVAGLGVKATFCGDNSLCRRPMKVLDYLYELDVKSEIINNQGIMFSILPSRPMGKTIYLKDNSAQIKSALMITALFAKGDTYIIGTNGSRNHTERMLPFFKALIAQSDNEIHVHPSCLAGREIFIPNDISTYANYALLALEKGSIVLSNVLLNSTRNSFLDMLINANADISYQNVRSNGFENYADVAINQSHISKIDADAFPLGFYLDEFPLLALAVCLSKYPTTLHHLSALTGKESNRIESTAEMLNNIGCKCNVDGDCIHIAAQDGIIGGKVNSFGDHRIAMAAVVAGKLSQKGVTIDNCDCINVSCPDFLRMLEEKC